MAEVVDRILEYLQQNDFKMAGDALRAEIISRRSSNGTLHPHFSSLGELLSEHSGRTQAFDSQEMLGFAGNDPRRTYELYGSRQKASSYELSGTQPFGEFPFHSGANRNGQQGSDIRNFIHTQQEQGNMGGLIAPNLSAQALDQHSREATDEMSSDWPHRERQEKKSSDTKAAVWQQNSHLGNGAGLTNRQGDNLGTSLTNSNDRIKSYKEAVETNLQRVSEAKFQNERADTSQGVTGEDTHPQTSSLQKDDSSQVSTLLQSYVPSLPVISNGSAANMPTLISSISGDTQVIENGFLRDCFSRSSATHVRLKTGFPFSLSSSYQPPPCKYPDDSPSVDASAELSKAIPNAGECPGDGSSLSCKQSEGTSTTNNNDFVDCMSIDEAKASDLSTSASFAPGLHHKVTHGYNPSVMDDISILGMGATAGNNWSSRRDMVEAQTKSFQEDEGARDIPGHAVIENWAFDASEEEDPGYYRQPIKDEAWFLAHEIDYPSDEERGRLSSQADPCNQNNHGYSNIGYLVNNEETFFPRAEVYENRAADKDSTTVLHDSRDLLLTKNNNAGKSSTVARQRSGSQIICTEEGIVNNDVSYHGGIIMEREFHNATEGVWYGSKQDLHGNGGELLLDTEVRNNLSKRSEEEPFGSRRSKNKFIQSSSQQRFVEARDSEMEPIGDSLFQNHLENNEFLSYHDESRGDEGYYCDQVDMEARSPNHIQNVEITSIQDSQTFVQEDPDFGGFDFTGFSFPSPSSAGELVGGSRAESGKSLWSGRDAMTQSEDVDEFGNGVSGADDTLASWRRKSGEFSPLASPHDDALFNVASSTHSTTSVNLFDDYVSEVRGEEIEEAGVGNNDYIQAATNDDKEREALDEQLQRVRACEEEYETFNLRIVHRKNRTGFEEDKDFPVEIESVIAGRYYVTEYLGSAAFSKAIQAHDLYTGLDVCMKIVKNNKDFFDQSLDEIKLLKYINKHDPADKHHILRLYDYFYHREHLFIVCELLRANLYEFQKYNKESGGEIYFTMPRLQSITRQCLEALDFLHDLGLIHCDLKPENILIKSYSRCEIKVIDLGSSCFQTDNLCSYVQSRSYRAPEVILGLPYDQKIDIWSLGCILAELCSGQVLFQNESLPTLLARVIGIIGPVDSKMLAKGSDTYKYFTKNHMLYERDQETNRLHYIIPKVTTVAQKLPMGDEGFIDFVEYLLQINPKLRPSAKEALNHPWISYPYEFVSS